MELNKLMRMTVLVTTALVFSCLGKTLPTEASASSALTASAPTEVTKQSKAPASSVPTASALAEVTKHSEAPASSASTLSEIKRIKDIHPAKRSKAELIRLRELSNKTTPEQVFGGRSPGQFQRVAKAQLDKFFAEKAARKAALASATDMPESLADVEGTFYNSTRLGPAQSSPEAALAPAAMMQTLEQEVWEQVCDVREMAQASEDQQVEESRAWRSALTTVCKQMSETKKTQKILSFEHSWNDKCTEFLGYSDKGDNAVLKPYTGNASQHEMPVLVSGAFPGADALFGTEAAKVNHNVVHILGPLNTVKQTLRDDTNQNLCRLYHWQLLNDEAINLWRAQALLDGAGNESVDTPRKFAQNTHHYLQFRNILQGWNVEAMYVVSTRDDKPGVMDIPGGAGVAARSYIHTRTSAGEKVNLYLYDDCNPENLFKFKCKLLEGTWRKWTTWNGNQWVKPEEDPGQKLRAKTFSRYAGVGMEHLTESAKAAVAALFTGSQPVESLTFTQASAQQQQKIIDAAKEARDKFNLAVKRLNVAAEQAKTSAELKAGMSDETKATLKKVVPAADELLDMAARAEKQMAQAEEEMEAELKLGKAASPVELEDIVRKAQSATKKAEAAAAAAETLLKGLEIAGAA